MIVAGPWLMSNIEKNEEGTGDRMATRPEEEQHWSSSTREGEAWPTEMDRREAELETKTKKTESYEGSYPESRLRVSLLPQCLRRVRMSLHSCCSAAITEAGNARSSNRGISQDGGRGSNQAV